MSYQILYFILSFFCFGEVVNVPTPASQPSGNNEFSFISRRLNDRCFNFINANGEIGDWGNSLISSIDRVGRDCFYNSNVFNNICPNFNTFSLSKKQKFVVYLWAQISNDEGSGDGTQCSTNFERQNINSKNVGLMRLEGDLSFRRRAGRNPTFCGAGDAKDIAFQMQCSASMFSDQHCSSSRSRPLSTSTRSYWGTLRPIIDAYSNRGGAQIFPGCTSNE